MNKNKVSLSLYELNKQVINQLPTFTEEYWVEAKKVFDKMEKKDNFYLLYGKEISYFTLFRKNKESTESFFDLLKECLLNIGNVKAFDLANNSQAIEIWVLPEDEEDVTVLYLFGYDNGVVDYA